MLDRLPRRLLRLEGLALALAALVVYVHMDYGWLALLLLILAPDLSMIGYVAGPRIGALAYDALHTTIAPLALGAVGIVAESATPIQLALIWLAHIGTDRAIGYGLKYPSGFRETHLQRV
jgi:hypothetical protein